MDTCVETTSSEIGETISNIFTHTLKFPLESGGNIEHSVDISGCVHITGAENIILLIEANRQFSERAASAFLEINEPVEPGDVPEIFGEIVNVIAGNLTGMFDDAHFTLPVVTLGSLLIPNAVASSRDTFRDEQGGLLSLVIYPGVPFAELAAQ